MLKLLPLLLLGGCAMLPPEQVCEKNYMPGSQYFNDCVAKVQSDRQNKQVSAPAPIVIPPPRQPAITNCQTTPIGGMNCVSF